jgi:hypothetical protein
MTPTVATPVTNRDAQVFLLYRDASIDTGNGVPFGRQVASLPMERSAVYGERWAERPKTQSVARSVAESIAGQLGTVPSMERVHVVTIPGGFECWVVGNQTTQEQRFALYDVQWRTMELWPSAGFEFHLVDREDHPLSDLLTLEPGGSDVEIGGAAYA